ncbi:MAG: VanZ family protein [Pseudomonadota bacterium]
MTFKTFWRGVFALLLLFVTWQTLTPDPDNTEPSIAIARFIAELLFHDERLGDKVAHFLAYSALGGSAAFAHVELANRRWLTIAALAAYGVLLEFLQGVGGVRMPEFADALANSSGALAAYPAALFIERALSRVRAA